MRLFNASHLEVKKYFDAPFQTNPYECGWASECIFFIHVEEMTGSPVLEVAVELSHDGIHWCPEGTVPVPSTRKACIFSGCGNSGTGYASTAKFPAGR